MNDDPDRRCMERLCRGDDLALNELMQRWKVPLEAFCFRYTRNTTDAREVAHETFVRVYSGRQTYTSASKFSTWMFAIAANLCRMRGRWKKRHPEVLGGDMGADANMPDRATGPGSDPSVQADVNRLAADLEYAIAELPHKLRTPFLLCQTQGMSHRDVAEIEKTTTKTIERRVARAKQKLRSVLHAMWADR